MSSTFKPTTPLLSVDIIIELPGNESPQIVLIERKYPPPGWALPGGFVDVGETVEHAAVREAREETSLDVTLTDLLGIYSDPDRDKRGHTASAVYIARGSGKPRALDDAANLVVCSPKELPGTLAFDHQKIVDDYMVFRATGRRPGIRE